MKVSRLAYQIPPPHQKGGDGSAPLALPMRSGPRFSGTPRVRLSRTLPRVGTLLVLLGVVGVLALTPARAAYGGDNAASYQWTNGTVLCIFNQNFPAVTVSALGLQDTGIGAGLGKINEISRATEAAVASAVIASAAWEPDNTSTSEWYSMNYTEIVNVTNATTPGQTLGTAWVSLNFSLSRVPANAMLADQVNFHLTIQNWPWQSSQDTLTLVVFIWSAFSGTEHVVVSTANSSRVESVRISNGQPLEYFQAGPSATTGTGAGVAVSPQTTVTASGATTTLTLGPGAANAHTLTYEATLGITPSTKVLGLPLYDYAAVAGGAGLVALAVGVGTRRIRRRPSDLTYVEESE
jgi:hypothetical protein